MNNTVEQITKNLSDIRGAIKEKGGNITDNASLEQYATAIESIPSNTLSIGQQVFIFYCRAVDLQDACSKTKPTITWDDDSQTFNVTTYSDGWSQTPVSTNSDEALYAMFLPMPIKTNSSDLDYSAWPIPIAIEGKRGEKGEKGDPGAAGIVTGMTRYKTATLYNFDLEKPTPPEFKFDLNKNNTSGDSAITGALNTNCIYYEGDGSKFYIDDESGSWFSANDEGRPAWNILVEIRANAASEGSVQKISAVMRNVLDVKETNTYYKVTDNTIPPSIDDTWITTQPQLDSANQRLWTYTKATYKNNETGIISGPTLLYEWPVTILNITTTYITTSSLSDIPNENDNWLDTVTPGPVIWKKEVTTFNRLVNNSDKRTVISPIAIQGPAGIAIIGKVNNESELNQLPNNVVNASERGKVAYIVGKNTYVWYGAYSGISGSKLIGNNYWLDIGLSGSGEADWNASEEDSGYIKNRTHYEKLRNGRSAVVSGFSHVFEGLTVGRKYALDLDLKGYWDTGDFAGSIKTRAVITPSIMEGALIWSTPDPNVVSWDIWMDTVYNENDAYICINSGADELQGTITLYEIDVVKLDPKYVPQMIEVTWSQLKELREYNNLIPGMQYRITDYVTTTSEPLTLSGNHRFDIIVTASSTNRINENAKAIQYAGDTYFNSVNFSAWELKYCLDNVKSRFSWADEVNGKGVIYYMKDEWNNECPYDFKNIMFPHPHDTEAYGDYYYTFAATETNDPNIPGYSDVSLLGNCCNNTIKPFLFNSTQHLNHNVFWFYHNHRADNNTFGPNCYHNLLHITDIDVSNNTFGPECNYNYMGASNNNTIGGKCEHINMYSCENNTIGNGVTDREIFDSNKQYWT